jgi:hypothetical protein
VSGTSSFASLGNALGNGFVDLSAGTNSLGGAITLTTTAGFADVRHLSVFGGFMAIHTARRPAR